ncbi:unnamed protein product, partial [Pylaiella littoralis]
LASRNKRIQQFVSLQYTKQAGNVERTWNSEVRPAPYRNSISSTHGTDPAVDASQYGTRVFQVLRYRRSSSVGRCVAWSTRCVLTSHGEREVRSRDGRGVLRKGNGNSRGNFLGICNCTRGEYPPRDCTLEFSYHGNSPSWVFHTGHRMMLLSRGSKNETKIM